MQPSSEPLRFGSAHCCACTAERGSCCGHINGPFLCGKHAERTPESTRIGVIELRLPKAS